MKARELEAQINPARVHTGRVIAGTKYLPRLGPSILASRSPWMIALWDVAMITAGVAGWIAAGAGTAATVAAETGALTAEEMELVPLATELTPASEAEILAENAEIEAMLLEERANAAAIEAEWLEQDLYGNLGGHMKID